MEIAIFIGAQAAGKSSFYQIRFFDSHVRVNLDMLRTRHRERLLIEACLLAEQPFVIDNTNATRIQRESYFRLIQMHCPDGKVTGFYFQSRTKDCLFRNRNRQRRVPEIAIRGTVNKLQLPSHEEGFDCLKYVRIERQSFFVEDWNYEI